MEIYTGKPDRKIEHYGIVGHTFQRRYGKGFIKAMEGLFSGGSQIEEQSNQEAMKAIAKLVIQNSPETNVIYEMRISTAYVPVSDGSPIVTTIYASYGRFVE